jgi:hypothetical protein
LAWVRAPTKAGTANPGMVAAMLVIPIRTPETKQKLKLNYPTDNIIPNLMKIVYWIEIL